MAFARREEFDVFRSGNHHIQNRRRCTLRVITSAYRIILASTAFCCFVSWTAISGEVAVHAPDEPYSVTWVGAMMTVHRDGDASPKAELSIANHPGGFAIGPIAGLRGEITVLDGKPYVARVVDDQEQVVHDWTMEVPFLVYGYVNAWSEVALPDTVTSLAELEEWLPKVAKDYGLDMTKPFPFKLELLDSDIDFHIISNEEAGYITHVPHSELMRHFKLEGQKAWILGVYSTEHAGVFTHHGTAIHVHMVSEDGMHSGHADAVRFGKETKLFLPALDRD